MSFLQGVWRRIGESQLPNQTAFILLFPLLTRPLLKHLVGYRVVDRQNADTFRSGIVVCNHTHWLDCGMVGQVTQQRRIRFTALAQNFRLPLAGALLSMTQSIPVEHTPEGQRIFNEQAAKCFQDKGVLVLYPEGDIHPYETSLQSFRKGAFHLAVRHQQPILPIVAIPEIDPRYPAPLLKRLFTHQRQTFRVEVLPPVFPPVVTDPAAYDDAVRTLRDTVFSLMDQRLRGLPSVS